MATKSFEELNTGALTIKNNELPESNTHTLVGTQLVDMVAKEQEIDGKVNDLATGEGSNIDVLRFNTATIKALENIGEVRFNSATRTLEIMCDDGVVLSIGQENYMLCKNDESVDVDNVKVVYVSGGLGANALVKLASNNNPSGGKVAGVTTQFIGKNNLGLITTAGVVNEANTLAFSEGDLLWLGTNGNLTNVNPGIDVFQVCIGIVLRSHATQGVILVAIREDWRAQITHIYSLLNSMSHEIDDLDTRTGILEDEVEEISTSLASLDSEINSYRQAVVTMEINDNHELVVTQPDTLTDQYDIDSNSNLILTY